MGLYQWPMPRRDVSLSMVLHARVRGITGQRRRQLLRWMDEEPDECDDQLQRWLPTLQFLY